LTRGVIKDVRVMRNLPQRVVEEPDGTFHRALMDGFAIDAWEVRAELWLESMADFSARRQEGVVPDIGQQCQSRARDQAGEELTVRSNGD
jgi:hypothetical protein